MRISVLVSTLLWTALAGIPSSGANPLRNLEIGAKAFPFSLQDTQGKSHSLDDYRDRPLVICYFRPGQIFSDNALAALAKMGRFSKDRIAFLAIYHPDMENPISPRHLPFPILVDERRRFYGMWGLFILPTTIVLDRDHKLRATLSSYQDHYEDLLSAALDALMGRHVKPKPAAPSDEGDPQQARVLLARKLLDGGRAPEALSALQPLLQALKPICSTQYTAADAMLSLGRPADAVTRLDACLKEHPSPHGMLLMGRALTLLGDYARAEEFLKKAAALDPSSQKTRLWLGDVYEKTGRKDQALAEYRSALERLLQ